jgi:hypothetical protein
MSARRHNEDFGTALVRWVVRTGNDWLDKEGKEEANKIELPVEFIATNSETETTITRGKLRFNPFSATDIFSQPLECKQNSDTFSPAWVFRNCVWLSLACPMTSAAIDLATENGSSFAGNGSPADRLSTYAYGWFKITAVLVVATTIVRWGYRQTLRLLTPKEEK